ncbi:hypothetical protein [Streptomyces sp. NPDC090022]|uniref:hypothetical protein n=1 Tax=Streptomyces sp. NPDC090022 TaxID=3365920 RepID=UPI00381EB702
MDEGLLEAARAVRPYLNDLVGDGAQDCDRRLAGLLARARAGQDVSAELLATLTAAPALAEWTAAVRVDPRHRPPRVRVEAERAAGDGGYTPLPSPHGGSPVDAQRYVCAVDGDFVWWRIAVGVPLGHCPDHPGVPLVRG